MNSDQKILACVDRTPVSDAVTDYAAWAARTLGAPLELLHVLDRHLALAATQDHSGTIGLDAQEKLLDKLISEDETRTRTAREAGRLFLHGLRERALAAGVHTVDTRLRRGDVEETLSEQHAGSRLLVLGKTGPQPGTAEHALGQHLEWVVRSVSRPVLVAAETYREPTRVLFAFDGSGITRKGVEMLAGSTLLKGLPLVLLMAGAPSGAETRQLELAAQTLKAAGIDAHGQQDHRPAEDHAGSDPVAALNRRGHASPARRPTDAYGKSLRRERKRLPNYGGRGRWLYSSASRPK